MSLLSATRAIMEKTEQLTGRPVHVQEDPKLDVLSTITTARGAAPMHLIRYKPTSPGMVNYWICFQCGFLLRLFENPPDQRFEFAGSADGKHRIAALLRGSSMPPQVQDMIFNGLMTQLRSVPIGLRVDDWLASQYPELRDAQLHSARIQLQQNAAALDSSIRKMVPARIFDANAGMNAAFANYWAIQLEDATTLLPYKALGFDPVGKRLLRVFDDASPESTQDRNLVDAWAGELGLRGWYTWTPYRLDV